MNKKKSFGLVGCGRIGSRHAEQMHALGKIAAVCDIDIEKANAFSEKYESRPYYDIGEFLENEKQIDLVAVCTPNGLHAQHTIKLIKSGFNVLCEKPLAITVADCSDMIAASKEYNRQLFVVKQNRFNPPVHAVKQLLEQKKLGNIFSVQLNCFWNRDAGYFKDSWHGTKQLDGGILYTQFSHFVDLLYWYFGDIAEIKAGGNNFAHANCIDFDDTVVAICIFKSGILGTLHFTINAHLRNMEGSLTIFGEKGTVKIGGQYLNELEYQTIEDPVLEDLQMGSPPNNYGTYTGSMSNHHLVYQNIINVLDEKELPVVEIYDGLKTVEIIERIYDATRKQGKEGSVE